MKVGACSPLEKKEKIYLGLKHKLKEEMHTHLTVLVILKPPVKEIIWHLKYSKTFLFCRERISIFLKLLDLIILMCADLICGFFWPFFFHFYISFELFNSAFFSGMY